jgi:hypothetical protein
MKNLIQRCLLLLMMFLTTIALSAQDLPTLSVQGTLKDANGASVSDGVYTVTFRLFNQETGGTPVWQEEAPVEVIGGIYSHYLGSVTPLEGSDFGTTLYLGLKVGNFELNPRTRMTYAPYTFASNYAQTAQTAQTAESAQSLVGTHNRFPSQGTVGVGTLSPDPNAGLHISESDRAAMQLISSSASHAAILYLRTGDRLAGVVHNTNGLLSISAQEGTEIGTQLIVTPGSITSGGNTDLILRRNQDQHIALYGGSTQFFKMIQAYGGLGRVYTNIHVRWQEGTAFVPYINQGHGVSLEANQNVAANGFINYSDARIKHNLRISSGASDLARLMNLQVTDYVHIDTLANGTGNVKGFIAQQVEQVYPEAVSQSANFIPNIYAWPELVEIKNGYASLQLLKAHGLSVGDEVRIVVGEDIQAFSVSAVNDEHTFTVANWPVEDNKVGVFVYGKKVADFRTVDYDKIHNLNVSATQELARRVAQLEADNAALRQRNQEMQQQQQGLRSEVNSMQERMVKLENLLISNAQR